MIPDQNIMIPNQEYIKKTESSTNPTDQNLHKIQELLKMFFLRYYINIDSKDLKNTDCPIYHFIYSYYEYFDTHAITIKVTSFIEDNDLSHPLNRPYSNYLSKQYCSDTKCKKCFDEYMKNIENTINKYKHITYKDLENNHNLFKEQYYDKLCEKCKVFGENFHFFNIEYCTIYQNIININHFIKQIDYSNIRHIYIGMKNMIISTDIYRELAIIFFGNDENKKIIMYDVATVTIKYKDYKNIEIFRYPECIFIPGNPQQISRSKHPIGPYNIDCVMNYEEIEIHELEALTKFAIKSSGNISPELHKSLKCMLKNPSLSYEDFRRNKMK